jgi:hypothetical protein
MEVVHERCCGLDIHKNGDGSAALWEGKTCGGVQAARL